MTPIKEKVLVKPFPPEEVTTGGIIIAGSYKEVNNKVTIVAVGSGTKKEPMQFKAGDIAFRVKDNGEEVDYNGEQHFILPQSWLIAKLN